MSASGNYEMEEGLKFRLDLPPPPPFSKVNRVYPSQQSSTITVFKDISLFANNVRCRWRCLAGRLWASSAAAAPELATI